MSVEDDIFRGLEASFAKVNPLDVKVERKNRQEFADRTRGLLLRLLGYPNGINNVVTFRLNKSHYDEGVSSETYTRIWTTGIYGRRLLQVARTEAQFDLDRIVLTQQALAVAAGSGDAYKYTLHPLVVTGDARSLDTRQRAGLPIMRGQRHETADDRLRGGDDISTYPRSGISNLENFRKVSPEEDAIMREHIEEALLTPLERLNLADLEDVS